MQRAPQIRDAYIHPQFVSDVMKPLNMDVLMDLEVKRGRAWTILS